jgi:hypothetical protein
MCIGPICAQQRKDGHKEAYPEHWIFLQISQNMASEFAGDTVAPVISQGAMLSMNSQRLS